MNTFDEFATNAEYESQKDLVGLAVYWLSTYCGEDAVAFSDVHDILNLYNYHISDEATATRLKQLKDNDLIYHRDRSGAPSGVQLTEAGFRRYDNLSTTPESSAPGFDPIVSQQIESVIRPSKYGEEVIAHIDDGDECWRRDLFHPALNSYIHVIEWAMIAYLDIEANRDIIQEEQTHQRNYYFAGRSPNLLEEVQNHNCPLSQKSESWITARNRSERRWIAHHKSGTVLRADVRNIRARLGEILTELF